MDRTLARRRKIDAVDADAEARNDFELGQRRDEGPGGATIGLGCNSRDADLEFGAKRTFRQRIDGEVVKLEKFRQHVHGGWREYAERQDDRLHADSAIGPWGWQCGQRRVFRAVPIPHPTLPRVRGRVGWGW